MPYLLPVLQRDCQQAKMPFRPQVSLKKDKFHIDILTKFQVQRSNQPVRLGGLSGLQLEQGSSDAEAARWTKSKTTAGASELQQPTFPFGAAAAAAADIAAAAIQQVFPLLGLLDAFSQLSCQVQAIHTSVQFGHFESLFLYLSVYSDSKYLSIYFGI